MLSRAIFSRLSVCCGSVLQQQSRVIPFTCQTTVFARQISCTACRFQEDSEEKSSNKTTTDPKMEGMRGYIPRQIDAEESIRYMESQAYYDVYKDQPVWKQYRKNSAVSFYPPVRRTCIRKGVITTGSACPICRDDYLVFDYRNVKLLKQFLYDLTGKPLRIDQTGLCQKQFRSLVLELAKAQDYGLLKKHFPLRQYKYSYYYDLVNQKKSSLESAQSSLESDKSSLESVRSFSESVKSASESVKSYSESVKSSSESVKSSSESVKSSSESVKPTLEQPISS